MYNRIVTFSSDRLIGQTRSAVREAVELLLKNGHDEFSVFLTIYTLSDGTGVTQHSQQIKQLEVSKRKEEAIKRFAFNLEVAFEKCNTPVTENNYDISYTDYLKAA